MHIKGLSHGTGDANKAADYLTNDVDHKGEQRGSVEVHSGDIYLTAEIANSLEFKNRYWSSVIGFHPQDKPTPEQIDEIISEVNKTLFAGMDESRFAHSWVIHRDPDGHVDIHNFGAKVDLETGKHFNPLPPGWQKALDPVRDYFNAKYGWKSPDIEAHPENARLVQPGYTAHTTPLDAIKMGVEDPRTIITNYIMKGIENGLIETRDDIIQHLHDAGLETPRIGETYITIKDPSGGKNDRWRLKGVLYDDKFTPGRAIAAETAGRRGGTGKTDQKAADKFYGRVEEARQRRTEYNQKRYQVREQEHQPELNRGEQPEIEINKDKPVNLGSAIINSDRNDNRQLGHDEVPERPAYKDQQPNKSGQSGAPANQRVAGAEPSTSEHMRRPSVHQNRRAGATLSGRVPDNSEAVKQRLAASLFEKADTVKFENLRYVDTQKGIIYFTNKATLTITDNLITGQGMHPIDAAQNIVSAGMAKGWKKVRVFGSDEFVTEAAKLALQRGLEVTARDENQQKLIDKVRLQHEQEQRINAAGKIADEAIRKADEVSRNIERESIEDRGKSAEIDTGLQRIDQGITSMIANNKDELERFKSDINIVEYLASQGYQIDKRESSRNSFIMRNGDDKLVVGTSESGHGVYFSVRDESNHGTIIDLVQKQQGKNLGQVRKELRPWIGEKREMIPVPRYEKPRHIAADRDKPLKAYMSATKGESEYLKSRGIDFVQSDDRFSNIRTFKDGSVIFPHYDRDGFSGYEKKGDKPGQSIFSSGGEKRVWHSNNINQASRIIIAETAIDALSHAELKHDEDAAYISFAGSMSPEQHDYLAEVIRDANARGATIVAATDNDVAGNKFADFIEQVAVNFERDAPATPGQDWNDELKQDLERSEALRFER